MLATLLDTYVQNLLFYLLLKDPKGHPVMVRLAYLKSLLQTLRAAGQAEDSANEDEQEDEEFHDALEELNDESEGAEDEMGLGLDEPDSDSSGQEPESGARALSLSDIKKALK